MAESVIQVGDVWGELDVPKAVAKQLLLNGENRYSCIRDIDSAPGLERLGQDGWSVVHLTEGPDDAVTVLLRRDHLHLLVRSSNPDRESRIEVIGDDYEKVTEVADALADVQRRPKDESEERTPLTFNWMSPNGVRSVSSSIDTSDWSKIRRNYAGTASAKLDKLFDVQRPEGRGRLILLHGEPGTGKTTAIRSLVRAWSPWCDASYVMDPEMLFSNAHYLNELVLEGRRDRFENEGTDRKWMLFVVEDVDELVRADAKAHTGQALSRLLNLTDGLLGQGTRVLVLMSTNESISALHPAIVRPGRCLAEIEVPRLDATEARAWAAEHGSTVPGGGGATLAELIAARDGFDVEQTKPSVSSGLYL